MIANWIKETTTTTGTGDLTLSAVTGFPRFSEGFVVSDIVEYAILTNDSPPKPLEWGLGTVAASNTLTRSVILGTYAASTLNTSTPTAVSLSAGTYNVICTQAMSNSLPGLAGIDTTNSSSGGFIPHPWSANTSAASAAVTADRLYLIPFRLATPRKIASIKMRVATGVAGNFRVGLYRCNNAGIAGVLIDQSADLSCASGGTVVPWTFTTARILPSGWYYFGFATKGVAPSFNTYTTPTSFTGETPMGTDATGVQVYFNKYSALTGGWTALPDPAPTTLSVTNNQVPPSFSLFLA